MRFSGPRAIGAAFSADFLATGLYFYSFSLLLTAIPESDADKASFAWGMAIFQVVGALVSPYIGRLADTRPIGAVFALGSALLGIGFLAVTQMTEIWHWWLISGTVLAVGAPLLGGLAPALLITRWYVKRRGTALGIAAVGISLSGFVMPIVGAAIIGWRDWQTLALIYGVVAILAAPLFYLVVIDKPAKVGQHPDGEAPEPVGEEAGDTVQAPNDAGVFAAIGETILILMRNKQFLLMITVTGIMFFSINCVLIHAVNMGLEAGATLQSASTMAAIMAGLAMGGKVVVGWLLDRMSTARVFLVCGAIQAVAITAIAVAPVFTTMQIVFPLFGLGYGMAIVLFNFAMGRLFRPEEFGRVVGASRLYSVPFSAIGAPVGGILLASTGNYTLMLIVVASLLWVCCGLTFMMRYSAPKPLPARS